MWISQHLNSPAAGTRDLVLISRGTGEWNGGTYSSFGENLASSGGMGEWGIPLGSLVALAFLDGSDDAAHVCCRADGW